MKITLALVVILSSFGAAAEVARAQHIVNPLPGQEPASIRGSRYPAWLRAEHTIIETSHFSGTYNDYIAQYIECVQSRSAPPPERDPFESTSEYNSRVNQLRAGRCNAEDVTSFTIKLRVQFERDDRNARSAVRLRYFPDEGLFHIPIQYGLKEGGIHRSINNFGRSRIQNVGSDVGANLDFPLTMSNGICSIAPSVPVYFSRQLFSSVRPVEYDNLRTAAGARWAESYGFTDIHSDVRDSSKCPSMLSGIYRGQTGSDGQQRQLLLRLAVYSSPAQARMLRAMQETLSLEIRGTVRLGWARARTGSFSELQTSYWQFDSLTIRGGPEREALLSIGAH